MGIKGIEKIRTEEIRARAGHVARKTEEDVVTRTWKMEVGGHQKIGRTKPRWIDVIRKYMK